MILLAASLFTFAAASAQSQSATVLVTGTVFDPTLLGVVGARVEFDLDSGKQYSTATDASGRFTLELPAPGDCTVRVEAAGFSALSRRVVLSNAAMELTLRLERVASVTEEIVVSGKAGRIDIASPDPSEKVMIREELLDANPGRPGAPVSIPGMPIETASGGIKAPQYFVPGVAGDHGEPIAQYFAVGDYLASNNLSANAHGNGYADPNIYVSAVLASVQTDGGAFSVLEGNHALNLAATYELRPKVRRSLTVTGDYRDLDATAGLAPSDANKKEWLAIEVNYGNGLLRALEHRQQYKWNASRIVDGGSHEITVLSIGYYGQSHEGNLVPLGYGLQLNDTIDPRQMDQTHSGILAVNDEWRAAPADTISISGFFRTYNLALFSNFGEGLIRQSEFRTVEAGQVRDSHRFAPWFELIGGIDYNQDDIHRDNLDHYLSADPAVYGPFVKVLANNVAIRELAPFAAARADLGSHLHLYGGLRHEQVEMDNGDVVKPDQSFDFWRGFESPKATLTLTPGSGLLRLLPSASLSIGQAFFTEDPRIAAAGSIGSSTLASPFERSHSEQLVLEKETGGTDVRLTLGRTTTTATLAKIDPDTGLAENEGPGTLKFLTAGVRHRFSFGTVQTILSKADARDDDTGLPAAEAPRTVFDALTTMDRLPLGLRARAEYEYVGHKFLDAGNTQHPAQYEAIPVGETRIALVRSFLDGRLQLGVDGMIARGYTGQTTETFAPGWQIGDAPPSCAPGIDGVANDFDCGTIERAVGIRTVSFMSGSISYRFGNRK
ncbi:MAG: TonB-dependent receptor [Terracidiphilus sp.]